MSYNYLIVFDHEFKLWFTDRALGARVGQYLKACGRYNSAHIYEYMS